MPLKRIVLVVFALALLAGQRSQVSAQGKFLLTIDNIMRGPELYGYPPQDVRWSGDNQRIYFQWKQASDPIDKPPDTWMVPRDSGYPRKLSDEDAKTAPPVSGDHDARPETNGLRPGWRRFSVRFHHRQSPAAHQNHGCGERSAVHAGRKARGVHARRKPLRSGPEPRLGRHFDRPDDRHQAGARQA